MSLTTVDVDTPVRTPAGIEHRRSERFKVGCAAVVTVFGGETLQGTLTNVGEGGAQLRLNQRVPPSSLLKIEYGDCILMGEVVYCQAEGSSCLVGIKVEHALFGLAALAIAMRGFDV
jgi:hypothetical protein